MDQEGEPIYTMPKKRVHTGLTDRVEKLIRRIRPAVHSERRRESVSSFIGDIIIACFAPVPVQAFMFGSVPLKTYLPDGDIDLCIFSPDTSIKDTWATKLHAKLEEEQQSPHSPFKIGDVQVINAEVRQLLCGQARS